MIIRRGFIKSNVRNISDTVAITRTDEALRRPYRTLPKNIILLNANYMTKLNQIYKCNICNNIVEVVHTGVGELVCCGQPMELQKENTVDAAKEKHVPVIEKTDTGAKIKIGSDLHPMEAEHYIEWIEVIQDGQVYRKFLKPGDKPEAEFEVEASNITARAYCNLHGLWKA